MLISPLRFLPLPPAQLSLAAVLKCGQTFLWRRGPARATLTESTTAKDGLHEWSYGHRDRTIVLRQDAQGIHYRSLFPLTNASAHFEDLLNDTTLSFLRRYFVLDTSLPELYSFWSKRDKNFAAKTDNGTRYGGIRILRQPTWECIIEFICSSNNNIARIEGMLRRISRLYGQKLPSAIQLEGGVVETEEDQIYAFPHPEDLLGDNVTAALRTAGFGYRDAYVTKTAALVCALAKESGCASDPEAWLETISTKTEQEAREALLLFSGVGPKVADCILLFGLGFENVVPVDTHVYQIAVRDYGLKGSKDATVNKAMYAKVNEKLRGVWGEKAGWAHQILFTADLKSFSDFADPLLAIEASSSIASVKIEDTETNMVKVEVIEQDADLSETPLPAKRKRTTVVSSSSSTVKRRRTTPAKRTIKREIIVKAEDAYPSPPETPRVVKKEEQESYFEETPLSLAERVKRTRRARDEKA